MNRYLYNQLNRHTLKTFFVILLIVSTLPAKGKLTLSGRIVNSSGLKVKKATLTLLSGGSVVAEEKKNAEAVRRMAFKAHFSRREHD